LQCFRHITRNVGVWVFHQIGDFIRHAGKYCRGGMPVLSDQGQTVMES
jgi:hypothetical protein